MCGLSGVAGSYISHQEDEVVGDLLVFNSVRGIDSTGLGAVRINHDFATSKALGSPYQLFGTKDTTELFRGYNKVLIGHNRSKTNGDIKIVNAHPFEFDNVIGAHNGTIWPGAWNRLPGKDLFETDSEAIFHSIDNFGVRDTISKLDGAWALVWYDKRDNTINLLRNKERTLYYALDHDNKHLFWASELEMLLSALNRNKIKRNTDQRITLLPENSWHQWKVPSAGESFGSVNRQFLEGHKWTNPVRKFTYGSANDADTCGLSQPVYSSNVPVVISKVNTPGQQEVMDIVNPNQKETVQHLQKWKIDKLREQLPREHKLSLVYDGRDNKVYYDTTRGSWISAEWSLTDRRWIIVEDKDVPPKTPFKFVDVNSNHSFKHQGKKKRKKIFYRGYEGKLLTKEEFEDCMKDGCFNCNRHPVWGNLVSFVSKSGVFFCEHCSMNPGIVNSVKGME